VGGPLSGKRIVNAAVGVHSMVVTDTGELFCWGYARFGQIGNRSATNQLVPVKVEGLTGKKIIKVAAGRNHSLALEANGSVWAWGANESQQLGNGSTAEKYAPIPVKAVIGGKKIIDIAADENMSAARTEDKVYVWGRLDSKTQFSIPTEVKYRDFDELFLMHLNKTIRPYFPKRTDFIKESFMKCFSDGFDDKETSDLQVID
jgi:alpha-tubulin suppressor-like RCC1 family protein